jgi:hypothetical protein
VKRLAVSTLLLAVLAGCGGYYNGMYNAERFAASARRAEREGRSFDAQTAWGQVAVRAESVLVKHPRAGWSNKARLLQGTALSRLNDCTRALPLLEQVMVSARQPELMEDAAILVGSCRVTVGDPIGATSAYARLTKSHDRERRNLALWAHGRALRLAGSPAEALDELGGSEDPRALGERATALALLGRLPEAIALADSMLVKRDSLAPWDSLYSAVAAHDPAAAAGLADRLAADSTFPLPLRVHVLLQDADRVLAIDTLAGDQRLATASALATTRPLRTEVQLHSALAQLTRADATPALQAVAERLDDLEEGAGPAGARMVQLSRITRRVLLSADSAAPGVREGDLRLFLAAELARDSLQARRFASAVFERIVRGWPDSPFAPKALLALIDLRPAAADSLRGVATAQYPGSPYVQFAEGGEAPNYQVLEDSLHRFALSFRPEGRRPPARPTRPPASTGQPKPTTRTPDDIP